MIDIKTLIGDIFYVKSIQDYINHRFQDSTKSIFNRTFISSIKTIQMHDGNIFDAGKDFNMINDSYSDYDISRLRSNDIVLDIGANVGGFSLRAARIVKHVYAVEPLMTKYLKRNIALNDIDNITVLEYGLGNTGFTDLEFHGEQKKCKMYTLNEIIDMCGGRIDYLKMDCEGGEWSIKVNELLEIPYITGELHLFNKQNSIKDFTDMLDKCNMNYSLENTRDYRCKIFEAYKKVIR